MTLYPGVFERREAWDAIWITPYTMNWISQSLILILPILVLLSGCDSDDTPDTPDTERQTIEFHGDISAGESYTKSFGSDYQFMLLPIDHGWFILIQDNRLTVDISRLTPPFHFVPNPRNIEGWHFRNSDNTGPNDSHEKNVNAPQEVRDFIFSPEVGRSINGPGSNSQPTSDDVEKVGQFGRGKLTILDYRLKDLEFGKQAGFEWIKFHVTLSWPR
jgi:hypothetical protein